MSRIAVIEDVDCNRLLLTKVLHHAGHVVLAADRADRGIALVADELPDLVLMDLELPDLDGFAALRLLRGNPRTSRIPVIALTAHAMAEDRALALQAGFDHYIATPIDIRTLAQELEPFLADSAGPGMP